MTACLYDTGKDLLEYWRKRKEDDTIVILAGCLNYIEGSEWMTGMVLHRRLLHGKLIGHPEGNQAPTPRQGQALCWGKKVNRLT